MKAYKIIKAESFEVMGIYHASSKQAAINKMAKKGVLVGKEWDKKYIAIPANQFQKQYKPNVN